MGKKIFTILGSKNVFILAYAFKQKKLHLTIKIPTSHYFISKFIWNYQTIVLSILKLQGLEWNQLVLC